VELATEWLLKRSIGEYALKFVDKISLAKKLSCSPYLSEQEHQQIKHLITSSVVMNQAFKSTEIIITRARPRLEEKE